MLRHIILRLIHQTEAKWKKPGAIPSFIPIQEDLLIMLNRPTFWGHITVIFSHPFDFERVTGVEPAALGLGSRCSTTELHPHRGTNLINFNYRAIPFCMKIEFPRSD